MQSSLHLARLGGLGVDVPGADARLVEAAAIALGGFFAAEEHSQQLPALSSLVWVDTVVVHEPGEKKEANQHADPEALLGALTPQFLSLGDAGSIIVAACNAFDLEEVWVFVEPDTDKRAYSVEVCVAPSLAAALSNPSGCEWIEVGQSEGVTAGFFLASIPGNVVPVVRIKDRSWRSDGPDGYLTTPGVSVLAVGFVATAQPGTAIGIDEVAVCATEALTIRQRVEILEEDGSSAIVSNGGEATLSIGSQSKVGDLYSIGSIVADGAILDGDVRTSGTLTLVNNAIVTEGHTVEQGLPLALPDLQSFVKDFPPVSGNHVTLNAWQMRTLYPGTYGNVTVNSYATLKLACYGDGTFFFESLRVESDGKIDICAVPGVADVHVRQGVTYRGIIRAQYGRSNLLVVGYGAEDFMIERPFNGTAVAVNGTLRLQAAVPPGHFGVFCGKHVVMEPDIKITRRPRNG